MRKVTLKAICTCIHKTHDDPNTMLRTQSLYYITLHSNYVVTITNFKADPKQTQTPNEFHLQNNSVSAVTETLIKLCVFWMSSTTSIPFYIQIFTQRPHQNAGIPIDCIRHLHLLHSTTCHTQFPTLC